MKIEHRNDGLRINPPLTRSLRVRTIYLLPMQSLGLALQFPSSSMSHVSELIYE